MHTYKELRVLKNAGPLDFNFLTNEVILGPWENNKREHFSQKLFAFLYILAANEGQVLSEGAIIESLWIDPESVHPRTIDETLVRLKKKLRSLRWEDSIVIRKTTGGYYLLFRKGKQNGID